jgi:hypothetical protein
MPTRPRGHKSKARFMVDLSNLDLSHEMQREIAKAIQATVLQILATKLDVPRPYIDLAKAPGPSGWAGAFVAEDEEEFEKLRRTYQWGRPGGTAVNFFD